MRITRRILCIIAALAVTAGTVSSVAASRGWEQQRTERSDARSAVKWSEVEVKTVRGAILITTTSRVQIKVFTILGQLISSETLTPGIWQLNMPAHGVYIVKANDLTCKVAV